MRTNNVVTSLFVLIGLLAAVVHAAEPPWISLFDGKTVDKTLETSDAVRIVDGRLEIPANAIVSTPGATLQVPEL